MAARPSVARGADRRRAPQTAPLPLTRADGTVVAEEVRSGQDRRRFGFISRLEIFRGVPFESVEGIVARCEIRTCRAGEVFLRAGQPNRQVALVLSGELRVRLDGADARHYLEVRAGESIGEMSVIAGQPASAEVVAGSACQLLLVDVDVFLGELLRVPGVARNLMLSLVARIRRNDRVLVDRIRASMELERLQRELQVAREIQTSMLPRHSPLFSDHPELDCAGRMVPAREVGGDFYDAFFIDPQRVFVAIGDVCGKGLPAAMFMMRTITLLRGEVSRRGESFSVQPQSIAARVNDLLCEDNDTGLFVTLLFGILDLSTGRFAFVSAGHNPPLLALPGEPFAFVEAPRNIVAGATPGVAYASAELTLRRGGSLVLYTDGITEAFDSAGRMYGEERFARMLGDAADRSAEALVAAVLADLQAFAGEIAQSDDITVVALRLC